MFPILLAPLQMTLVIVGSTQLVLAGMPSPELVFTELGRRRWEEVSFFLVGFLTMAAVVRWLWNIVRRDIPTLPELSYRRSIALLLLWGLMMTVVLALVSGARELMTPGAWEPNGVTHKLAKDSPAKAAIVNDSRDDQRRLRLENLRFALWEFAKSHDGRFPLATEIELIQPELWIADLQSSLRFVYVPGQTLSQSNGVLVYEPEVFGDSQYVILTSGVIAKLSEVSRPSFSMTGPPITNSQPSNTNGTPTTTDPTTNSNEGR